MEITDIYEHYKELIKLHSPTGKKDRILKLDAWNEAEGGYKSVDDILDQRRTTYLELDVDTIKRAAVKQPFRDFRQGDIRDLPFTDSTFSAIFDLSTIDHIPATDIGKAIGEYRRCLKPGGTLVLVCWCTDEPRVEPVDWGGPQYFHQEEELRRFLWTGFVVEHSDIFHRSGHELSDYLIEIVARKELE